MQVEGNYVDSHGESEIGFAVVTHNGTESHPERRMPSWADTIDNQSM